MNSLRAIILSLTACLVFAVVATGCGSDGGSTASDENPSSLTKAEFIKEGDLICKETDRNPEQRDSPLSGQEPG
jgi:hypothetical protein